MWRPQAFLQEQFTFVSRDLSIRADVSGKECLKFLINVLLTTNLGCEKTYQTT